MGNSIRFRLWSAATISILVALAIAGVGLRYLFELNVERRIVGELTADLNELIGATSFAANGQLSVAPGLTDPRFTNPLSGHYWQVEDLASHARKVALLARGGSLDASMSRYLVERIKAQPNIEVLTETEIEALEGEEGNLATVRWRNRVSGQETTRPIGHLFLFIGADPNTDWLAQCNVALDAKGFVRTGSELGPEHARRA